MLVYKVRLLIGSLATVVTMVLLAGTSSRCNAITDVYVEHFSYPTGAIDGRNGGGGWLPSNPWRDVCGGANVVLPGLICGGMTLPPAGNALGATSICGVDRSFLPINGSAGEAITVSFLVQSNVNGTPSSQASIGIAAGFEIGDLATTNALGGNWGISTIAGEFYSLKPVVLGQLVYVLAKIDFHAGPTDRVRLWVSTCPIPSTLPAPDIDETNIELSSGDIGSLLWHTQGLGAQVDEIHLAVTH